jgi:glucose-1-phosphate thymidylyltransferase
MASEFVRVIEKGKAIKLAALKEVAYRMGFISKEKLAEIAGGPLKKSGYGNYLLGTS